MTVPMEYALLQNSVYRLRARILEIAAGQPYVAYCRKCTWGKAAASAEEAEHLYELHKYLCQLS